MELYEYLDTGKGIQPCLTCGDTICLELLFQKSNYRHGGNRQGYQIKCPRCGFISPIETSRKKVIARWNSLNGGKRFIYTLKIGITEDTLKVLQHCNHYPIEKTIEAIVEEWAVQKLERAKANKARCDLACEKNKQEE